MELGRFQDQRRRVIAYADIPTLVLDATTTAEDRSFWDNAGIDPAALVSAVAENASGVSERGASTITQQLVRARLLPEDIVSGSDRYLRKAKEIIQALRLTDEYPGASGKERVISAYLNEIYYGHEAYGIAAAADVYFGVTDLSEADRGPGGAAGRAPEGPLDARPVPSRGQGRGRPARRATGRRAGRPTRLDPPGLETAGRWTKLTPAQVQAAIDEPVVLAGERPIRIPGGQFTWQVRRQLRVDPGAGRRPVETRRLPGHHDARLEGAAARRALARRGGHLPEHLAQEGGQDARRRSRSGRATAAGSRALRGKDLHNGALVALDYRTGDVLAYAGSAGYARDDLASKRFEPKYDAAGDGARQPGSAFKPILYAAAFESKRLSPGSLLLDVTTEFDRAQDWAPRDADQRERGPVLVRRALQYSLNIPAIRALHRVGSERVADTAEAMGIRFAGGRKAFLQAGLAGALGTVEVRPLDLTSAYGTIANGGVHVPPRMILEVRGPDGKVVWKAREARGRARDLRADRVPGERHPGGQHGPGPERDLGGEAGPAQRPRRVAPAGRRQDRHHERRP